MKSNQDLSILLWRRMDKQRTCDGKIPIYARMTINFGGGDKEIGTGVWIFPEEWDISNKIVLGSKKEIKPLNDRLNSIKTSLEDYFKLLKIANTKVTASMLKRAYKNGLQLEQDKNKEPLLADQDHNQEKNQVSHSLLETITCFINEFEEKVNEGNRSKETLKHWRSTKKKFEAFISSTYNKNDLQLNEIRPNFALTFLHYMTVKAEKTLSEPTAMKQVKKTKQILEYAVTLEWLSKNPLAKFKCKTDTPQVEPLEFSEVLAIYNKKALITRLEEVRDVFIFQTFTGFAFQDLYNLTPEHIVEVGIKREKWLMKKRGKTEVTEMVPILPIAQALIEKYKNHPKCVRKNRLMPVDSNARYNGYLKELAIICNIQREDIVLDTHLARHTFADMMLNMGVPLEDVSKMLGHKSIRTTQRYCRVKKHRISKNMNIVKYSLFDKNGGFRRSLERRLAS